MSLKEICPECQNTMVPIVYAHSTPYLQQMEADGLIKIAGCQVYLGYSNGPRLFCQICKNTIWPDSNTPKNS